jgi:hypothetical protein
MFRRKIRIQYWICGISIMRLLRLGFGSGIIETNSVRARWLPHSDQAQFVEGWVVPDFELPRAMLATFGDLNRIIPRGESRGWVNVAGHNQKENSAIARL